MNIHPSIHSLAAIAAILLGLALAMPGAALAGPYEEALAVVEAEVGVVGDTNTGQPGSVAFRIFELAIAAKEAKAAGDDATALAKILEAEEIVIASN